MISVAEEVQTSRCTLLYRFVPRNPDGTIYRFLAFVHKVSTGMENDLQGQKTKLHHFLLRASAWSKLQTVLSMLVVATLCRRRPSYVFYCKLFVRGVKQIRSPQIDPCKLDRKNVRELLDRPESFDWDKGSDASEWSGVSLDSEDRIMGLNVPHKNLSGELPAALGELSNLEYLHATSNLFTGET